MKIYNKLRSKLTIFVNRHPLVATFLFVFIANLLIVVLTAALMMLLKTGDSRFDTFHSALYESLKWLVNFGGTLSESNHLIRWISIPVGLLGVVIFSGTIIALTTNAFRNYMSIKIEGRGKLKLDNHYIILNYNTKVLAILIEMLYSNVKDTIVLLSDQSRDEIYTAIASEIAVRKQKPTGKLNLIVRKGDPFMHSELTAIGVNKAKGVLIMDKDHAIEKNKELSTSDFEVLKLLISIAELDVKDNCQIDIETESYETVEMINKISKTVDLLKGKSINSFSFNRKLGQFLALSVICPRITGVLYDLLSLSNFEFRTVEKIDLEKYLQENYNSIPIATLEKTYVLSSSASNVNKKRRAPFITKSRIEASKLNIEQDSELFIIGENKRREYLLEYLAKAEHLSIKCYDTHDRKTFIEDLKTAKTKKIALILSDDTVEQDQLDSNVYLTLIDLHSEYNGHPPFKVVAEIINPKNQSSMERFNIFNLIVSNRIISFFAIQTLMSVHSNNFYEELFTHFKDDRKHHFDIWVKEAKHLFDFNGKHRLVFESKADFIQAAFLGTNKKVMPIGKIEHGNNIYFSENTDEKVKFILNATDHISYVEYL